MSWLYTLVISLTTLLAGFLCKVLFDWLKGNKQESPPGFGVILSEIKKDIQNIFAKLDSISNGYTKIQDFKELQYKHDNLKSQCDIHFGEYKAFQLQTQETLRNIEKRNK